MVATACPSRETLLQYSLGMLPTEPRNVLDSHMDGCPNCQATIMTLDDADDTVIGRLRMPVSSEAVLAEPQLQEALAAAMAMPEKMRTAEAAAGLPGWLASDMPEMLGEYRLLEELGRGGMGRVYKALHTKLDRVVAVKVLPRGLVRDQNAVGRFAREMRAVGRLAHRNIVQAHDAREIDGTSVLIMEFVDGLDLAEIVRRLGPLPVPDACELIRQTALALQCAYMHGLVHRDVKPSNIMLAKSGEVKLLDLGLARFFAESGTAISGGAGVSALSGNEEMTGIGQAMGTADYMAPEQASDSRTVDIRADLYSLGCTLYKLLSGRAPFDGAGYRSTKEKLHAHLSQPVPPIRQFAPDVPKKLVAILDRMLAKNPADRFAKPVEVAEALAPRCTGADLPALLQNAVEAKHRPEAVENPRSQPPRATQADAKLPLLLTSWGWKWFAAQLVLLMMAGGLGFGLGIVIRIHKDGTVTTINVAEGSNVGVNKTGDVDVEPPGAQPVKKVAAEQTPNESRAAVGPPSERAAHAVSGRLPQGTVELVGITNYPPVNQSWWAPDGSPVKVGSLQPTKCRLAVSSDEQARVLLVRFKNLPADASWPAWKLDPSGNWEGCSVVDVDGHNVPEFKALCALLPGSARTANFRVGVGMGAWETMVRQKPDSSGTSSFKLDGKRSPVVFQQATAGDTANSARVECTHNVHYERQVRVVAIDNEGKENAGSGLGQYSSGAVVRATAAFPGLPLSSVKEFQFQVRPFYWVEFPNLALNPRSTTAPLVELPNPAVGKTASVNPAAELKALQGTWKVVRLEKGDAADAAWPLNPAFIHPANFGRLRIMEGYLCFSNLEDGSDATMPYQIDPAKTPKTIDLRAGGFCPADQTPPVVALGIYEVQGNQLKVRLARYLPSISGNERPKDFSIDPQSGDILFVLERNRPAGDEKTIQDEWTVASEIKNGKAIAESKDHSTRLRFGGEPFGDESFAVLKQMDNGDSESSDRISDLGSGTFALNPGNSPKSITLFNHRTETRNYTGEWLGLEKIIGIYKFDGERLTIAFSRGDKPPDKFESKPGSGVTLLVLEKPKKPAR